jgi:replicative DNA helicase
MSSGWLSGAAGVLLAARRGGGAGMAVVDERWPPAAAVRPAPPATFDRQPPQDLAAEQSVLGGMLMSKDAIADVIEALRSGDFYKPAHTLLQPTTDEIDAIAMAGGQAAGVPTGFADLDNLTNGLHPGQMVIVAARPGIGKSTLALDIARHAAVKHRKTVVIFSLEMSKTEITMRMLSAGRPGTGCRRCGPGR